MKYDDRAFRQALSRFSENSKKSKREILAQQAKLFVRDVVKVTPPNKDGKYNPKGGRAAIRVDLSKIFRPSTDGETNPAELHQRFRNRQGRVRRTLIKGSSDKRIPIRGLPSYVKLVIARMGILASGWNAAARAFGLSLPVWISRHGTKYGSVKIKQDSSRGSITITNGVRFAGDVRGMDRRVQWALDNRGRQMDKQVDDLAVKKAAKAAGLRVK